MSTLLPNDKPISSKNLLESPRAILFDAGGVLLSVITRDVGISDVAQDIIEQLTINGVDFLSVDRIEFDLQAGLAAYSNWKRAQSRRARPRELAHSEFWGDFVAADWPDPSRRVVVNNADILCQQLETAICNRTLTNGALEILEVCKVSGLLTGVVSNSLSGIVTRNLLTDFCAAKYLDVQIYSDEVGVRKPNPAIFNCALNQLQVEPADAWYVGDKYDRDILAAHRAGLGQAILIPSEVEPDNSQVINQPDRIIHSLWDLVNLLPAKK